MTDPIADMLTRMRNALMVKKETVEIPASNMKAKILDIMANEGYINSYEKIEDGVNSKFVVSLKYFGKRESVIKGLKRVSRPGLRIYTGVEDMPKVLGGLGIAIVSTNKGVMTGKEAAKLNVGGEVLCYIW